MAYIKSAKAEYTGGGVWIFYGQLTDNTYFLTDDNDGSTLFLDESPEDFDKSLYEEWQNEHKTREYLEGDELSDFLIDLLNHIEQDKTQYITETEINRYREYWELTDKTYIEIEENYCPKTDMTFVVKWTVAKSTKEYISSEVIGYYFGQPDETTQKVIENNSLKAIYDFRDYK